jgi:sugar lactone lactonase YvrE
VVVEQVTGVVATHGEGPCWDERTETLYWVDMLAGAVLATDPASGATARLEVGGPVAAFVRPLAGGDGIVVACEHDVQLLDAEGPRRIVALPFAEDVRSNEGSCDPQGRLWVGTLAYDVREGGGAMWRVDLDGTVDLAFGGVTISNGLAWSPAGDAAYFVDTATRRIDRFDFDGDVGHLHGRAPFGVIGDGDGHPDGICVDADGGVWVALVGPGIVRRYDADGVVSTQVEIGCGPTTACAFGGPQLATLFVTTSRYGGNDAPGGGALFACTPGVAGLPVAPCRVEVPVRL